MVTSIQKFLRQHPLFTRDAFMEAGAEKTRSVFTSKALLAHHVKQGHIVRIRRGLFASIPPGSDPKTYPIDPYLIAAHLADDAVIGYHTALAFHGVAYSSSYRFIYLTQHASQALNFRNEAYQSVSFPRSLVTKKKQTIYTQVEDVKGMNVRVSSLERTLVDVMDRPQLGGGWEEIWRSLNMINHLKIEDVVKYALILGNATTIAKVGYYLEQRMDEFKVSQAHINKLLKNIPVSPNYMDDAAKKSGTFISKWNLIVSSNVIKQSWDEPLDSEVEI